MDDEIRNLLNEEIKQQIQDLSSLEAGSDKKSKATEDVVKLCKLAVEEEKTEQNLCEQQKQLNEQTKDRYVKIGIAAAEIILPLIFYACWIRKGLKFEETGSFTSATFKGLINRFRPTK